MADEGIAIDRERDRGRDRENERREKGREEEGERRASEVSGGIGPASRGCRHDHGGVRDLPPSSALYLPVTSIRGFSYLTHGGVSAYPVS